MARNSPEERSSHVVRAGILKSHISSLVLKRRSVFTARYELNVNVIRGLIGLPGFTQSASYCLSLGSCSFNVRIAIQQLLTGIGSGANAHILLGFLKNWIHCKNKSV
jgi:hypothetical protein